MLQQAQIGRWCVEIDAGCPMRLYADKTFLDMMGMSEDMSPEESYAMWVRQIPSYEKDRTDFYYNEMIAGRHCEVEYFWLHSERGMIYIRCSGSRDDTYKQGIRLRGFHQDITDLVQVKQNLDEQLYADKHSENMQTGHGGGLAVVQYNEKGVWKPKYISEGFAKLCGMTPTQMRQLYEHDAMAGVHPEDKARFGVELKQYLEHREEDGEFIYRLIRADGSYFWVRNVMNTVRREDDCYYTYCSVRDITKERDEQEELRHQFRRLLNSYYHGLEENDLLAANFNITQDRVLDAVNDKKKDLLQQLGNSGEAFISFISQFIVDKAEAEDFLQKLCRDALLEQFANGHKEVKAVYFVKSPIEVCGRYAEFKLSMLQDPDSKDVLGVLTIKDATNSTINNKIIRQLFALSTDRVFSLDLLHDSYELIYAASKHRVMISRQGHFAEYVQEAADEHVLPEDRKLWLKLMEPEYMLRQLREHGSYSFTFRVHRKAGKSVKVKKMLVAAIDLRLGRVCVARMDVTDSVEEERRSKQAIEQALAAAEHASRAKSEFLSNMSHDIRTPMNAIIGMTHIALDSLQDAGQVQSCLQKIDISGKHLLGLINNVLDMSKIEAGRLLLTKELVDLAKFMEGLLATVQPQAAAKNQQLEVRRDKLQCQLIYSDGLRLSQVLLNILGNAVKYTPEGGQIIFSVADEESPKGTGFVRLRFTVKDNGIGMTSAYVEHIFESFSREDKQRVHKTEGSGLGMAITKYIVDAMGGEIAVQSWPGCGSEFVITLDVERGKETAPQEEQSEEQAVENVTHLRVLLVDDNKLNREIATLLLSRKGVLIEEAENGRECVEKFCASSDGYYDAILMDVRMPVMNGYEATQAIRGLSRKDAAVPIIAMTADAFAEDTENCLRAGMNAHVPKPIDINKLMEELRRLCKRG